MLSIFREMGALCIDADRIVAGLLEDLEVLRKIKETAGDSVFEGEKLSKKKLAGLIFTSPEMRGMVEGIIHPLAIKEINKILSENSGAFPIAVVEIPLLYEKGYEGMFDKVITVFVDEKTALARLMAQGIPPASVRQRLSVQMPLLQKVARADYVINNQGGIEETKWQSERIFEELSQLKTIREK